MYLLTPPFGLFMYCLRFKHMYLCTTWLKAYTSAATFCSADTYVCRVCRATGGGHSVLLSQKLLGSLLPPSPLPPSFKQRSGHYRNSTTKDA